RRRLRRHLGAGVRPRYPDPVAVPARAPYGLCFRLLCRRDRIRRRIDRSGAILWLVDENRQQRADRRGPCWNADLYGGGGTVVVPYHGERRDGCEQDAGYGYTAAADEL